MTTKQAGLLGTCTVFQSQWGIGTCVPMSLDNTLSFAGNHISHISYLIVLFRLWYFFYVFSPPLGTALHPLHLATRVIFKECREIKWALGEKNITVFDLLSYENSHLWPQHMYTNPHDLYILHQLSVECVCKLLVRSGLRGAAVWRSRVEIVWHMHHRGDSVSEGGSQQEKGEREWVREWEQAGEKTREGKREGRLMHRWKLGQLHIQRLI